MALATKPAIVKPAHIIDLGELTVDYDESIAAKIAGNTDPRCITWNTSWATDEKFPDTQTGEIVYAASAWHFGVRMSKDSLKLSVEAEGKIFGTPKPLIDLAIRNPQPKLDDAMPLVAAGQEFVDASGNRIALDLVGDGVSGRRLGRVRLFPNEQWYGHYLFLVLART